MHGYDPLHQNRSASQRADRWLEKMSYIVGVHGIAQQYKSEVGMAREWHDSLLGGLRLAAREQGRNVSHLEGRATFAMAFYGDVFRRRVKGEDPAPVLQVEDLNDEERGTLVLLWEAVAAVDPEVPSPIVASKSGPQSTAAAQRALLALCRSRYFGPAAARCLPGRLRQASRYFAELDVRLAARRAVEREVSVDTTLLIGHSLGSVVAYEALCAHPEWNIRVFITLGSPLGIPSVVYDRLWPEPSLTGRAAWPGSVKTWFNVADQRDPAALVKDLNGRFGDGAVTDLLIDNGPTAHDVVPYLTAVETGRAVLAALDLSE